MFVNVKCCLHTVVATTASLTTDSLVYTGHDREHHSFVATTGSVVKLSCTTDTQDSPIWDYYPYGSSQAVTIFNGKKSSEDLNPRFSVDLDGCHVNKCSLTISSIQMEDAGRFVCLKAHSIKTHLSLVVLGQYFTAV